MDQLCCLHSMHVSDVNEVFCRGLDRSPPMRLIIWSQRVAIHLILDRVVHVEH